MAISDSTSSGDLSKACKTLLLTTGMRRSARMLIFSFVSSLVFSSTWTCLASCSPTSRILQGFWRESHQSCSPHLPHPGSRASYGQPCLLSNRPRPNKRRREMGEQAIGSSRPEEALRTDRVALAGSAPPSALAMPSSRRGGRWPQPRGWRCRGTARRSSACSKLRTARTSG